MTPEGESIDGGASGAALGPGRRGAGLAGGWVGGAVGNKGELEGGRNWAEGRGKVSGEGTSGPAPSPSLESRRPDAQVSARGPALGPCPLQVPACGISLTP